MRRRHRAPYEFSQKYLILVGDLQKLIVEEFEVLRVAEWGGIFTLR